MTDWRPFAAHMDELGIEAELLSLYEARQTWPTMIETLRLALVWIDEQAGEGKLHEAREDLRRQFPDHSLEPIRAALRGKDLSRLEPLSRLFRGLDDPATRDRFAAFAHSIGMQVSEAPDGSLEVREGALTLAEVARQCEILFQTPEGPRRAGRPKGSPPWRNLHSEMCAIRLLLARGATLSEAAATVAAADVAPTRDAARRGKYLAGLYTQKAALRQ